jgi:hypothetical protein
VNDLAVQTARRNTATLALKLRTDIVGFGSKSVGHVARSDVVGEDSPVFILDRFVVDDLKRGLGQILLFRTTRTSRQYTLAS